MTTLDDLLAAVAADPGDTNLRGVLGDHLEELGDTRATSVRLIRKEFDEPPSGLGIKISPATYQAIRYLIKLRTGRFPSVKYGSVWTGYAAEISLARRGIKTFCEPDAIEAWRWSVLDTMHDLFPGMDHLWDHDSPDESFYYYQAPHWSQREPVIAS
jgi:uncharacterized protein (TIGR02996 family)